MNPSQSALAERFSAFIAKLKTRQQEIFNETAAGVAALLQHHPGEVIMMMNAINGIEHQNRQLLEQLHSTWHGQISGKYRELDDGSFWDQGIEQEEDAAQDLEHRWHLFRAKTMGDVWRAEWPRVQASLQRPKNCRQCGGPVKPTNLYQAETVKCSSCGAMNQLLLEVFASYYFSLAPTALAEEATADMRYEIERFRTQTSRRERRAKFAEEHVADLNRWLEMEHSLWQRYAEVVSEVKGEPVDEAFVEQKMGSVRKTLVGDQVWVRAAK